MILTAPTKGRNSLVNCGANGTCSQPCSKLILPPPPASARAAALLSGLCRRQGWQPSAGRGGRRESKGIKTSSYPRETARITAACWHAGLAQEGSCRLYHLLRAEIPGGQREGKSSLLARCQPHRYSSARLTDSELHGKMPRSACLHKQRGRCVGY